MRSSKLINSSDPDDLKPLQFREFGEDMPTDSYNPFEAGETLAQEPLTPCEESPEQTEPEPAEKPEPEPEPAPAIDYQRELETAFRQGREEALQEARQQLGHASDMLAQALEEVSRLRGSLLQNSSNDMLRLVMSIVRQVLHAETSVNPQIIIDTIEKALQMAVRSDHYHVRVNPADLETVTKHKPLFLASINGLQNLTFQADPNISSGGCLLESEIGDVDATIDGQLDLIHRSLLATLEQP
ncbi:flagellar assembly protein FliH [Syntrophotalea carbinolica DSM 2380]|uniref:Flagellar assembly protein FliH n=1 Tax=Syntrophotalea carbinolica (strain DSM 2380 / NBRC 103641 / GraBd1) TaxID=338963 RepID=Q3A5B8_SYNC1|nr:flagellar assembly protein FliH [Syntrophotalea carbinolica]ABA88439.1 flagellar assembly protein FliH [Syntrophotalea carbinolica DSM 2380]